MSERPSLKPAKVARIPYLNTAPFYLHWNRLEQLSEGRWLPAIFPPRQLGLVAEAGELDAGVMPLADLIRLEQSFEPLLIPSTGEPISFGIANRERVDSVLLFLHEAKPASTDAVQMPEGRGFGFVSGRVLEYDEALSLRGARIAVTGETSTSLRLLRLLLEVRYRVEPARYERMDLERLEAEEDPGIAAALAIGDLALRWRHRPPRGFRLGMDLATAWFEWSGFPFVFARWVVRRDLPESWKLWLGRFLEDSLNESAGRLPELVRDLPQDLGPKQDLVRYLENFTYRLGPEEMKSAALFRELLDRNGITCTGA
jgi:predicted solute-binding protein